MEMLLVKVQTFLQNAQANGVALADPDIEAFGEACKTIIRKQFVEPRENKFRLRMSNVGKPLCQLQMELGKATPDPLPYSQIVQNTYGDILEAFVMLILKSSGINVQSAQEKVSLDIGGITLEGTYDVELESAIWDIKSVSPYSWDHKFGPTRTYRDIARDDPFGYIPQGVLYSVAAKRPFGGWIAINKGTGEINFLRAPTFDDSFTTSIIEETDGKIRSLIKNDPFARQFTDKEETFRKQPTGNRILGNTCSWCPYKKACWGKIEFKPSIPSEAANPKWEYYTHIDEKWRKNEKEQSENPPWEE